MTFLLKMFKLKFDTFGIVLLLLLHTVLAQIDFDDEDIIDDEDDEGVIFEKFAAGATDDLGRLFGLEKQLLVSLDRCLVKAKKEDIEKVQEFYAANKIDKDLLLRQVAIV